MDGWGKRMCGSFHGWLDRLMVDEWMDGQRDRWMSKWSSHEWMNRWTGGWLHGWIDGWVDESMSSIRMWLDDGVIHQWLNRRVSGFTGERIDGWAWVGRGTGLWGFRRSKGWEETRSKGAAFIVVAVRLAFLIDKMGSRRHFHCRVIARYERN